MSIPGGDEFRRSALRDIPSSERTIPALLNRQASVYGDRVLVRAGSHVRTYAQLRELVARRAGTLHEHGVRAGDRVALMCSNRIEMLETMLACCWLGAIAVPINTALRGEGLRHVLTDSGAGLLLAEHDQLEWIDRLGVLPDLRETWVLDASSTDSMGPGRRSAPEPAEPVPAHPVRFGDVATILYTSGTTGPSKGVLGPHGQLFWFAVGLCELLELDEDDVLFTCLPLFHINAWSAFAQALAAGATYALGTRFSASRFWREAARVNATITYLLGPMIPMLLRQPESEFDQAHKIRLVNGAAPPPDVAAAAFERFGLVVAECYASTEAGCALGAPPNTQRPGWMGRPMPGYEAAVVDGEDRPVSDGEPGELVLRPTEPFITARGYHAQPEATVATWRNLWFHTGDRVVRDGSGYFRFLDRVSDSIRRRGENISSYEVEAVLQSHPLVEQVAVFPVASELGEDEVMAAVVLTDGASLDALELVRYCEGRLAYFAIPRYVEFVDRLPLTENGKVRKYALRERGVTESAWDLEQSGHRLQRPSR